MDAAVVAGEFRADAPPRVNCPNCAFGHWASGNLTGVEAKRFNGHILHCRSIKRHDYVHRTGAPLRSVSIINSGVLKTCVQSCNGKVQITGFSLRGDMIGLDAIAGGVHHSNTIALEDSSVCGIEYSCFEQLTHDIPALQHLFNQTMSAEIAHAHDLMTSMGATQADERIVIFLLDLSNRFAAIGRSSVRLRLPMGRQEICEYLGLTLETVSRTLSRLQEMDAITIAGKDIEIKNVLRMWQTAQT